MKIIFVKSCENCPNVRKMAISTYCVLNGAQNNLPLDYKIPEWCPYDDVINMDICPLRKRSFGINAPREYILEIDCIKEKMAGGRPTSYCVNGDCMFDLDEEHNCQIFKKIKEHFVIMDGSDKYRK